MPTSVSRAAAVAEVGRLAERHPTRTVLVGVDGFGAAGKTTLAADIAAAHQRVVVVHVDDFSGPGIREWDWDRLRAQLLLPLLDGRPGRYQVHDEWRDVPVGAVVVIEGVSSTRTEVGAPWDLTIWVDAPRELRLARALARDGEGLRARWLEDWLPSEQAWAARDDPQRRVDLVVSGVRPPADLGESTVS